MNNERIQRYLAKFDEINRLGAFYETVDELFDYAYETLVNAYNDGWDYVEMLVDVGLEPFKGSPDAYIFYVYDDGEDLFDKLEKAYNEKDIEHINLILATEYHRLFNVGSFERAIESSFKSKVWNTVKDNKVRATHSYIDNIKIPVDAKFITSDGDKTQFPGGFSNMKNNINCRCWLTFI